MSCESDSLGSLVLGAILQQSNSDLAVSNYRKYYHDNPASPMLWNNLGVLCSQKGKKLAAISCLRRSSYLDPLSWVSLLPTWSYTCTSPRPRAHIYPGFINSQLPILHMKMSPGQMCVPCSLRFTSIFYHNAGNSRLISFLEIMVQSCFNLFEKWTAYCVFKCVEHSIIAAPKQFYFFHICPGSATTWTN